MDRQEWDGGTMTAAAATAAAAAAAVVVVVVVVRYSSFSLSSPLLLGVC